MTEASPGGYWQNPKPASKLDVLRAKQINRMTRINIVILILCLLLSFSHLIWARTAAFENFHGITTDGRKVTIRSHKRSILMSSVDGLISLLQVVFLLVLTPVYFLRVFRNNKRGVTSDQVMVGFKLMLNTISVNPAYVVFLIHDYVLYKDNPEKQWSGHLLPEIIVDISVSTMFLTWGCGIMLYIWIRLHMFSIIEKLTRWQFFKRVVLPKLLVALVYWTLLVTTYVIYRAIWGYLPFTSLICVLRDRRATGGDHIPFVMVIYAGCITTLEIVMILGIAFTYMQTKRVLRPLNYFVHRSRIVAFRFFIAHNFMFGLGFIFFDNLHAAAIPPGSRLYSSFKRHQPGRFRSQPYLALTFGSLDCIATIILLKIVWIVVTAYVSLPPDSIGWRGWFKSCDGEEMEQIQRADEVEPVSFSLIADPVTKPNIFGFRDVILMFNLSWLVYTKSREDMDNYSCHFVSTETVEVIFEEKFETKVVLMSLSDRIIIAFRGTTSTANIMTDLKLALDLVDEFLPSRQVETHPKASIKGWKSAKLHHGFAVAYQSVAEMLLTRIEQLLSEHHRPVYLTGHSLGGALATVCSLDLLLCEIGLDANQVTVMTFGSPRCGNKNWSDIYDQMVPCNWNVRIESDIVSMLPRFPYSHVGKKALLTIGGNLILDPSELESKWSNERPSLKFHKKSAYKIAFTIVCMKHLQGTSTGIWHFPVNESEVRPWEENCKVTFNEHQLSSLVGTRRNFDPHSKKPNSCCPSK